MHRSSVISLLAVLLSVTSACTASGNPGQQAKDLSVGAGQEYTRIEAALAAAHAGDTILVYPREGNRPYEGVTLYVTCPRITIRAVNGEGRRIQLCGRGTDYSGRGAVPRAIVQFNRGADDCRIEGFELTGAHNESHNGAGIRINQANRVSVLGCEIHHNDMGIMSNGDGTPEAAVDQRIEDCLIHSNGDVSRPGYSHNLYLGGTSATLVGCEIRSSLVGHNVKSRCHRIAVMACYVHDSANREFDLVDAATDTARPGSDAVLVGNIIVKSRTCSGNRNVVHFGQDGGNEHNGTLYLVHNTILTPYITPVVDVSAAGARVQFYNNIIWDGGTRGGGQQLIRVSGDTDVTHAVSGAANWVSHGFTDSARMLGGLEGTFIAGPGVGPPSADSEKGDFRLTGRAQGIVDNGAILPADILQGIGGPLLQYQAQQHAEERPVDAKPDLGAYEWARKIGGE